MQLREAVLAIERARESRVLLLAATNLDLDLLPVLHERLQAIGRAERLDVLVYCRGGQVGAARRIAMLLHGFTERLAFLVPDRCESAGTILALAGREIVASPVAVFSPVDPQLDSGGAGPGAIAAEDVRLFGEMAERWFSVPAGEAGGEALSVLVRNIFPTTLCAFYRATLEVEAVCRELLGLAGASEEAAGGIVEGLLRGRHSHGFPLAPPDLAALGLPVVAEDGIEAPAAEIAGALRGLIGPRARVGEEEGWTDQLVATREGLAARRRMPGVPAPVWEREETR